MIKQLKAKKHFEMLANKLDLVKSQKYAFFFKKKRFS